jgi:predicted DNA-binding transcriptional regulator AlpA
MALADLSLRMLTLPEVADLTGVSTYTIQKMLRDGTFPEPVPLVRQARWSVSTIRAWAEGRWRPTQSATLNVTGGAGHGAITREAAE